MLQLKKRYRISGFGAERLLNTLRKNGMTLWDIQRPQPRCIEFSVSKSLSAELEEAAGQMGFSVERLPARGLTLRWEQIRQRRLLLAIAIIFVLLAHVLLQFIWSIEIVNGGRYTGEIRAYLRENGICPGILKHSIQLQQFSDGLLHRLPGVAWARCRIAGNALRIDITPEVTAPKETNPDHPGNIVAECDGIVERIAVFSGKAAVRPGDAVKAGDVLIYGLERADYNGAERTVHARGHVKARMWRSADALMETTEIVSTPTGRETVSYCVVVPGLLSKKNNEPDYLAWDMERTQTPVVGAWFPVYLEKRRYIEVSQEERDLDPSRIRQEAGGLAMRNLLSLCGNNDEIIDKWLIFSMIEGDTIQATATAELISDIGRFAAYIPD